MPRSDLVICRGGPCHRRVYSETDWQRNPAPLYQDTGAVMRLADVYVYGLEKARQDDTVRVWKFTGVETSAAAQVLAPSSLFPRTCWTLGCEERATQRITAAYDGPWFACAGHGPGIVKAFGEGRPIDYRVDTEPC